MDGAASAGFDAVKFQKKRTIDKVYSKEYLDSPRESPWGATQRQQQEGLELRDKNLRLSMFTVKRKIYSLVKISAWMRTHKIFT